MAQPTLSVLCFNYNHGRYLRKCFAGLQAQTFTDFEIVITDDGSTDDSADIIREYAAKDSRFKVNLFPQNRGVIAAYMDVSNRATGRYTYGAGADDFVINRDFFKNAVTALENDPRPAGFYGITGIYHAEKEKLVESCGTAEVEGYNTPLQCAQGFLKCRSVVVSPSCIWRRDLFLKHGGLEMDQLYTRLGPQLDFFQNHALAFTYGMIYEKSPFACQRIYEARTNLSSNLHLWETASRFAEMEKGLRAIGITYPGMEVDWMRWRAFWMMDTIRKSGAVGPVAPATPATPSPPAPAPARVPAS
jgi:glycosyltransferase involved in cell wall biosynthesis